MNAWDKAVLNAHRYDALFEPRPHPEYVGLTIRGRKLNKMEFTALGIKYNCGTECAATYLKDVHGWPLERTRELLCIVGRDVKPLGPLRRQYFH